jgi:hypothetical protein
LEDDYSAHIFEKNPLQLAQQYGLKQIEKKMSDAME